ncbi:MAG TPA: hypothetical protein VF173_17430 [Thermoanaerobaculia bacterium]|nr:hypothetical protein [Thermoanaerobaculia bacterium]
MVEDIEKARHWRYFLLLEADFERSLRFVEPAPENAGTFSLEFLRQLLSACAQFEVLTRLWCEERAAPGSKLGNIGEIREAMFTREPYLSEAEVNLMTRNERVFPFRGWTADQPPVWWTAYNKVKHDPVKALAGATLANVRDALAALGLVAASYVGKANRIHPTRVFSIDWDF